MPLTYEEDSAVLPTYSMIANDAAFTTVMHNAQNFLLFGQIEKNGIVLGAPVYLIVVTIFSFSSVD